MKPRNAPLAELLMVAHRAGGEAAVHALTKALGGKWIYIPKKAVPNHPLALAAGMKVAEAVVAAYGGDRVEFPKGNAAVRRMIAAKVDADGGSLNDIAAAADVTWRWARKLRKEAREHGTASPKGKIAKPSPQIDIEDYLQAKPRA